MKINKQDSFRRRLCMFLAFVMLFTLIPAIGAMPATAAPAFDLTGGQARIDEVREILETVTYREYSQLRQDVPLGTIEIPVTQLDMENTVADFREHPNANVNVDGRSAFYLPEESVVSFTFNVPPNAAGRYNLQITYQQIIGRPSDIERLIRINGRVPFREARYVVMSKVFRDIFVEEDEYGNPAFQRDIMENELRARREEAPEWRTVLISDSTGFMPDPFLFELTPGEHTISFEAVREAVYFADIRFIPMQQVPTYEEFISELRARGVRYGNAEIPTIQAQKPTAVSHLVINPINDRTSAITYPQDPSRVRLNAIGGMNWQRYGEWVRYEFYVPQGEGGLYQIAIRFRQAIYSGIYTSRRIRVNGEVPFHEANNIRFNFDDRWQVEVLNCGNPVEADRVPFFFYFQEGWNVIELEVSLGDMREMLGRVEDSVLHLNEMYRKIRMITGTTPDPNRDYGFPRQIPDVLIGLRDESLNFRGFSAELEEILGSRGEHSVILDRTALQLERMANNVDRIASGMGAFNGTIGGMGAWLFERRMQPLEIDWIRINRADDPLPRAEATFFQMIAFEFTAFIMSFFADFDTVGVMEAVDGDADQITVWMATGRDQAQIIRQLAVDFVRETHIHANILLVAPGSLLPSILAGVGPEVSIFEGGVIDFAIRNAILPLNDFQGDPSRNIDSFDQVRERFHPSAFIPLTLHDNRNYIDDPNNPWGPGLRDHRVFGLPETQTFQMLFYRKDVFVELGLNVPRTWDELFGIVPELQQVNLDVGMPNGMPGMMLFMFQNNVDLYVGDGIMSNLDHNDALDAFRRMTEMFTTFRFPVVFDFANRFRSGEMPIALADYGTFNLLTVFAPEIRGLWEFVPIPGTIRQFDPERDYGMGFEEVGGGYILDNRSPTGVGASLMTRNALNRDNMESAWAFMQWWTDYQAQANFGNEMVSLMGPAAMQTTANIQALYQQPWPTQTLRALQAQFEHLAAAPDVPGAYIVGRYVGFAWLDAFNNGTNPVEALLDGVVDINRELTRKRREFGMPVVERDRRGRILNPEVLYGLIPLENLRIAGDDD